MKFCNVGGESDFAVLSDGARCERCFLRDIILILRICVMGLDINEFCDMGLI